MAGFRQRGSEAVSPCVVANVQDVLPGGRRWPPQWANRNGTKRAGWREAEKASSPADLPDGPGCLYRQNHPGRIASYHPRGTPLKIREVLPIRRYAHFRSLLRHPHRGEAPPLTGADGIRRDRYRCVRRTMGLRYLVVDSVGAATRHDPPGSPRRVQFLARPTVPDVKKPRSCSTGWHRERSGGDEPTRGDRGRR